MVQIGNWLYQNAMAIFISAIASLLISKRYYDKANRESVLMMVIFPIVKLLNEKYYTRNDYEALFEINSSYAVKYLRKKERNKLLELLSAYRDVCKYSKENADTSCIMAYYNYKLKEKGINPKPCAITDDDGEVVADDFPPDYNYLQDYVYKIVSSFDFIESPEECTIKIADAFKCYTEKYYTGEEITYFKDYSIEKVIELSEISKKWNDKFRRADKSKEEFLNLPICKKVKNIIDESSVNKYVNRKIDEKEYNYKEYEQRRIRDNMILEDVKKANEVGSISRYSEEQIQCAQKEEGKKAINVIEGDFESELFDSNIIEGVDWKHYDTNLKLEFRKNDSDTRVSIQDALYKILEADEKFKYIIYDHGSGEMADYITIYETDNELVVELYHVKKMGSSSYNNSVGDVYEVSGQAIKSVTWFTTKGKLLEKFTSRHNSGHCIVKKGGNFKTMIKEIKTSGKVLRGCICIVQPGIKKSKAIPDRIQEVLAATDSYVKKAGKVNRLRIMGSI